MLVDAESLFTMLQKATLCPPRTVTRQGHTMAETRELSQILRPVLHAFAPKEGEGREGGRGYNVHFIRFSAVQSKPQSRTIPGQHGLAVPDLDEDRIKKRIFAWN